jgi:hypothetical protein
MRARRCKRNWLWPRAWQAYLLALGWCGCRNWSHNLTWRDA